MDIKVQPESDSARITLVGPFDAAATKEARDIFSSLLDDGKRDFIIDLDGVEFIDSSGLGVLVGFLKKVRIGEGNLRLHGVRKPIMKIFELTHLDRVFEYTNPGDVKS
ncbi:MAG: STAS domain-containing protein [Myxococcota bacterium]